MDRIIYKNADGSVAVIIPADCGLTIDQIAAKDVPAGVSYKIVSADEIPADRSQRAMWDVPNSALTDGTGADYGAGSKNEVTGWNADGTPSAMRHREAPEQVAAAAPKTPSFIKVKPNAR